MPAFVINNTIQLRLVWQYAGTDTAVNVVHAIKDDPLQDIDQAGADGIATNIRNALQGNATAGQYLSNQWKLARVGVRDVDQPNLPEFIGTAATPWIGSNTGELLPLNVACCVTLRTDRAGRSYRGRFYVSGFTEAGSGANGSMSAAAMGTAAAVVNEVRNGLDASGYTMGVASRVIGATRPLSSVLVRDNRWDTQRRRIVPGI